MIRKILAAVLLLPLLVSVYVSAGSTGKLIAEFDWFTYEGKDKIFEEALKPGHYRNPVIAGYYPDPSIVRVENDYYLVNSSFAYFPGLPVFHSKDLVNWKQIGHALNDRAQLTFEKKQNMSHGIFAPTIRYHKGLFYIITTDVYGIGNFFITAKNPAGPWSKPTVLPEVGGIDPDLFFDDDGRVYIAHNEAPDGEPLYNGHRAIWLWELDLKNRKVLKESRRLLVNGGVDLSKNPIWIEAPHLYKVNGWYYLSCAEGGTGGDHSQVVFRSKSLNEPFVPYENNPILTQRDLPYMRPNPVSASGHADIVQIPDGSWWAVFLATRPFYDSNNKRWHHTTGRETFLLPVSWQDGWPKILDQKTPVAYQLQTPKLASAKATIAPQTGNFLWRDDFSEKELKFNWTKVRSAPEIWHQVDRSKGLLQLQAQNISLSEKSQPSFLARRQQHQNFIAQLLAIKPESEKVSSGLALFQNSEFHFFLGIKKHAGKYRIFIEETFKNKTTELKYVDIENPEKGLILKAEQREDLLYFSYLDTKQKNEILLLGELPASKISTQTAGGFVGVTLGPHVRLH